MTPNRRALLQGGAALAAALMTPEVVRARAAQTLAADWSLATADLEGDVPRQAMRLVHGRAPEGLEGVLFRNGPAKFRRPGGNASHWFDGDGLMRAFRVADGRATLEARFADTPKRRWESEIDAVVTAGFGTAGQPGRAKVGSPDDASAANTAVLPLGHKVWALWEGGSPLAMEGRTLATEDFVTLRPDLKGMPFQAHPRIDPDGSIWNIGLNAGRAVVWRLAPDGALIDAQLLNLTRASYMHDFTATARHLVLVLQPWIFARAGMPYSAQFEWKPEMGTQVLVVDKADLSRTRIFELPAFSFFHLGDAWEEADGTIRFDVAAHDDPSFSIAGGRDLLLGKNPPGGPPVMALITLGADGRARLERTGTTGEFPKNDPRRAGLRRRLSAHVAGERDGRPLPTGLAVQDWDSGRSDCFLFGDGHVVEEFVFAPKASGSAETDAWLIGPSINLRERATELHVFEAGRVADGPVASWRADLTLPAGFHGAWAA